MFKILNHSASYQLSYSKWSQKLKTITKLEGIANERLRILIEPLLLLLQEAMGSGQVTTVTTVVSYLWLRDLKYLLSIMSPQYDILISSIASIDYETSQLSTSIKKTLKLFQAPLFFLFVANGHPFCLFKRVVRLVRGRWWWRMLVIMIVLVMNFDELGWCRHVDDEHLGDQTHSFCLFLTLVGVWRGCQSGVEGHHPSFQPGMGYIGRRGNK